MQPSASTPPMTVRPPAARCRLVFEGLTDPRLPREIVLERLRRLLKDAPDVFERRLARLPLVLLPDSDSTTARRYQRLLAQKGVLCRIVTLDAGQTGARPAPATGEGSVASLAIAGDGQALLDVPLGRITARRPGFKNDVRPIINLGAALCFNPRGVIGRVESGVPYGAALILAAGVGLMQGSTAVLAEHPAGAAAMLLTVLAILTIAPALGILFVYVRGFLLHAAGRLLKGRATPRELRVALAWSEIPLLLGGLIALLQFVMGRLGGAALVRTADPGLPVLLSRAGFGVLQAALGFWALTLLLHTLAEIQGFSLYRAFANIVLAATVVLVPLAVLGGALIGAGLVP